MLKKDIIKLLDHIDNNAEVIITVGDDINDIKTAGDLRGCFTDRETGSIILNFNESKNEPKKTETITTT